MGKRMNDITAVYYTANVIDEGFAKSVRWQLLFAIGDIPLVSVSQKPIDFGRNICIGDMGPSLRTLYHQVLLGAKEAKTKYVALCEDDVLYLPDHFHCYRSDCFGYNHNRWGIYLWDKEPIFSYKNRSTLCQCIAPRELLIATLEERFAANVPDYRLKYFCEPGRYEHRLEITLQRKEEFRSPLPNIKFSHLTELQHMGKRKKHGDDKTKFLYPWGSAEGVIEMYVGRNEWKRQST